MIDFTLIASIDSIKPLLAFAIGIAVYGIFVFKFYRFLAKRDIFEINLRQYNKTSIDWLSSVLNIVFYIIEYILLFPLFVFFWFIIIAILLTFLSQNHTPQSILLISMALVASVRIVSYYSEDLSKDLAKIMPFTLLGVFLVDISFFSLSDSLDLLIGMTSVVNVMVYYLVFVILLELALRIIYGVYRIFFPVDVKEDDES